MDVPLPCPASPGDVAPCPAPTRRRVSVAELRRELVGIQLRERAKKTAKRTEAELLKIERLGVVWVDQISRETLSLWREAQSSQHGPTLKGYFSALRAALRYAVACGYLERDPTLAMPMRFSGRKLPRKRCLSEAETEAVFALLRREAEHGWEEHRIYALATTVFGVGLRVGEALNLRVAELDLERGLIDLRNRALKTEASSTLVAMPDCVIRVLTRWSSVCRSDWLFPHKHLTGPWISGGVGKRPVNVFQAAAARAGVPGATLHMGRHGWATFAAARWGLSRAQIQAQLRHASDRTQEHYVHADGAAMRDVVKTVPFPGLELRPLEGLNHGQKTGAGGA